MWKDDGTQGTEPDATCDVCPRRATLMVNGTPYCLLHEAQSRTSLSDLCQHALEHYDRISNDATHYNSLIPDAIRFYAKYYPQVEAMRRMREGALARRNVKHIMDDAHNAPIHIEQSLDTMMKAMDAQEGEWTRRVSELRDDIRERVPSHDCQVACYYLLTNVELTLRAMFAEFPKTDDEKYWYNAGANIRRFRHGLYEADVQDWLAWWRLK